LIEIFQQSEDSQTFAKRWVGVFDGIFKPAATQWQQEAIEG
jgi:hypothetical protein